MSEPDLLLHHRELRQFLEILDDTARTSGNLARAARAREKLFRLSTAQFRELATDVYDELKRRIGELRTEPDYLLPRQTFHPKRNQARKKLSLLPQGRFKDLALDISFEIERRQMHVPEDAKSSQSVTSNTLAHIGQTQSHPNAQPAGHSRQRSSVEPNDSFGYAGSGTAQSFGSERDQDPRDVTGQGPRDVSAEGTAEHALGVDLHAAAAGVAVASAAGAGAAVAAGSLGPNSAFGIAVPPASSSDSHDAFSRLAPENLPSLSVPGTSPNMKDIAFEPDRFELQKTGVQQAHVVPTLANLTWLSDEDEPEVAQPVGAGLILPRRSAESRETPPRSSLRDAKEGKALAEPAALHSLSDSGDHTLHGIAAPIMTVGGARSGSIEEPPRASRGINLDARSNGFDADHRSSSDSAAEHEVLQQTYQELQAKHRDLLTKHSALEQSHIALQETHRDLSDRHDDLQRNHEALRGEHDELKTSHEELAARPRGGDEHIQQELEALRGSTAALRLENAALKNTHARLSRELKGIDVNHEMKQMHEKLDLLSQKQPVPKDATNWRKLYEDAASGKVSERMALRADPHVADDGLLEKSEVLAFSTQTETFFRCLEEPATPPKELFEHISRLSLTANKLASVGEKSLNSSSSSHAVRDAAGHALKSTRYYAAHALLPKIVVERAVAQLAYSVCDLVKEAKIAGEAKPVFDGVRPLRTAKAREEDGARKAASKESEREFKMKELKLSENSFEAVSRADEQKATKDPSSRVSAKELEEVTQSKDGRLVNGSLDSSPESNAITNGTRPSSSASSARNPDSKGSTPMKSRYDSMDSPVRDQLLPLTAVEATSPSPHRPKANAGSAQTSPRGKGSILDKVRQYEENSPTRKGSPNGERGTTSQSPGLAGVVKKTIDEQNGTDAGRSQPSMPVTNPKSTYQKMRERFAGFATESSKMQNDASVESDRGDSPKLSQKAKDLKEDVAPVQALNALQQREDTAPKQVAGVPSSSGTQSSSIVGGSKSNSSDIFPGAALGKARPTAAGDVSSVAVSPMSPRTNSLTGEEKNTYEQLRNIKRSDSVGAKSEVVSDSLDKVDGITERRKEAVLGHNTSVNKATRAQMSVADGSDNGSDKENVAQLGKGPFLGERTTLRARSETDDETLPTHFKDALSSMDKRFSNHDKVDTSPITLPLLVSKPSISETVSPAVTGSVVGALSGAGAAALSKAASQKGHFDSDEKSLRSKAPSFRVKKVTQAEPEEQEPEQLKEKARERQEYRKSLAAALFRIDLFDIDSPNNTLTQVLIYLEHQTQQVIVTTQGLLEAIKRRDSLRAELRLNATAIERVISEIIAATTAAMNQSRHQELKTHADYVVRTLTSSNQRIEMLARPAPDHDDAEVADRSFRQRLAGVSYDIAKQTRELVKTVEEVSLREDIADLDMRINREDDLT